MKRHDANLGSDVIVKWSNIQFGFQAILHDPSAVIKMYTDLSHRTLKRRGRPGIELAMQMGVNDQPG